MDPTNIANLVMDLSVRYRFQILAALAILAAGFVLAVSGVRVRLRPWCKAEDYWQVQYELHRRSWSGSGSERSLSRIRYARFGWRVQACRVCRDQISQQASGWPPNGAKTKTRIVEKGNCGTCQS